MTASGRFLRATLLLASLVLAACGGDSNSTGGGTPAAPPTSSGPSPTCTAPAQPLSVAVDANVPVGRVAGAVVAGCTGPLRDVVWQQTSGPALSLISARTQAISIEPTATGSYGFRVDAIDASGTARSATVTVNVTPAATPVGVVARSDQAVRMGGKASVRAWPPAAAGETLSWTQIAGPTVALDASDSNRIIFTAPTVANDTTLVFRVTRSGSGAADSDDVMVLVEASPQAPADPSGNSWYAFSDIHVSRTYAYKPAPANPFASLLVSCTYNPQLQYGGPASSACALSALPFLHTTTGGNVPTVAQIMNRVVVSHDWMGRNFEELLTASQSNTDLLRLFNGVTAIVIGAHVRPSYYYAATGAIYLDADNFWRTADERDVIDEAPDFRSDFGRDLQFGGLWRYVEGNTSIFFPWSATSRAPRDASFVLKEAAWLLYHELGHASDFVPPGLRNTLDATKGVWANIAPRYTGATCGGSLPSDQLCKSLPLTSGPMRALAQVKFSSGPVADTTLINGIPYSTLRVYSATEVAGFFAADRATDEYNYVTPQEDIAMTFEETLMVRNHSWRRDFAITDKIGAGATGSSIIVRWGQRGRVGDAAVKPRAQFVVGQLAPWVLQADPNAVSSLPAPIAMRAGESWTANLAQPAPPAAMAAAQALAGPRLTTEQEQRLLQRALSRQLIGMSGPATSHWTPNERLLKHAER
jgi:hypothetical protein